MARSEPPSGTSTPRSFTNQTASTEDLIKSQTVGLVHLEDFRKRRAEVLEQKEKEAQDRTYGRFKTSASGVGTPIGQDDSDECVDDTLGYLTELICKAQDVDTRDRI